MIKVSVTETQAAKDAIKRALDEFATSEFVTVGIHESAGVHPDAGITQAQLGAVQQFGNDNIPPRPWLDVGLSTGNQEYISILRDAAERGERLNSALDRVGVVAVGKVQEYVINLNTPPNAQSTIDRKGSSNPLIDTGSMVQSITYTVQSGKPDEGLS